MKDRDLAGLWARHSAQWRDTAQVASQWREASDTDPRLLEWSASPGWWDILARLELTLLVTREYEHLVMALSAPAGRPRLSFFPLPHPSGLTVDRINRRVYVASTRNPNQVFLFKPARGNLERLDVKTKHRTGSPLVPVATTSYPGSLYIHDLAFIGRQLCASAVGHNAVVRLGAEGCFERIWWPRCVERGGEPVFGQNHIQLNSIAAGETAADSFYSASSTKLGRLRPGHLMYPVDGRGVIFSGRTREPVCTGLTRPHSARLAGAPDRPASRRPASQTAKARRLWVANSGYGEVGYVSRGRLEVVARLPGWTRGLCIVGDVGFAATSRVIPKYERYAPGLDVAASRCAVYAISLSTGTVLGSLEWPQGNQVFAIDWIRAADCQGFCFPVGDRRPKRDTVFFYTYLSE
ncbi:MAG TPA: DUF4915 domain-containing protein [Bryobacteraceae bacterium]|nr:DUF4915 domain-containing protein [Bryobacteraceae bacterium]HUO29779.1 DUF4915 domain-containing protein [Bryobacteraceae bacterium]